jgi:hypothetical protein
MQWIGSALIGAACAVAAMRWQGPSARAARMYLPARDKYLFRVAPMTGTFQVFRMDVTTGAVSVLNSGKWGRIADDSQIGAGDFDLEVDTLPDSKSVIAVRSDTTSGRGWYLSPDGTKWIYIQ